MSQTAFQFTTSNNLLAQPSGAGEALVAVSTNAADTMNTTVHGNVAGVYANQTVALTGQREVATTSLFQTLLHQSLASAAAGTVTLRGAGTAGVGFINVTTNPANNDTFTFGLTGFTRVYTFKTVLTGAANEIAIGATEALTATNIKKAINDEGTEGTHYGTGTTINEYVTATVSTTNVTITDKIACLRGLGWSLTQSGTGLSLQAPIGGANGTLLAQMTAGQTRAHADVDLDNEDLADANLLAGLAFESDWVSINGKPVTLHLNVAGANMTFSYKTQRVSGGVEYAGLTTISAVGSSTPATVNLSENAIQRMKLLVTNAGSSARNVSAHAVY